MKITVSASYHTPGPWMAVPGGRHDQEVIITTQHRLDQSFSEICGMDVEFTGKHGDEQKANARLIAAAPELLDALTGLLAVVNVRIDDPRTQQFDKARAAIAKAEGEQA